VHAVRHLAADEHDEPCDHGDEQDTDRPHPQPDEVRDREQQAKEDSQPVALEVLDHAHADR
jgi:hypothetical protein